MSDWGPAEWAMAWQSAPAYVLQANHGDGQCADPVDGAEFGTVCDAPDGATHAAVGSAVGDAAGGEDGGSAGSAAVSAAGGENDDPADLRQLEIRIRGMAADLASSTCEWLHLLERFDREGGWVGIGIASCAAWLSWTCSVSPGTAREYLRVARALPLLPLVDAAFAAGKLSYSKVRVIVTVADAVDEKVLLEQAQIQTVSQLERTVRAFRRSNGWSQERKRRASWRWDDDGMLVVSARLPADEGALLIAALERARDDIMPQSSESVCPASESVQGGAVPVGVASVETMPVGAESVDTVDGAADCAADGDDDTFGSVVPANSVSAAGDRWHAELTGVDAIDVARADMLIALAQRALAAGDVDSSGDDRHLLVVHVDADQLVHVDADQLVHVDADQLIEDVDTVRPAGDADLRQPAGGTGLGQPARDAGHDSTPRGGGFDRPPRDVIAAGLPGSRCHIENGPGLERRTAQRIACDAACVAVLHNVGDGEPLRLGRKTRAISPAQRRALRIRDEGCRFPGCHRRTHLEAHHVRHWSLFGPTDLDNLVLLCRFHHMLIHEAGFAVVPSRRDRRDAGDSAGRGGSRGPCGSAGASGSAGAGDSDDAFHGWEFRDPHGVPIPAAPSLLGWRASADERGVDGVNGSAAGYCVAIGNAAADPFSLLPQWRGEPFHLVETVAALAGSPRSSCR